MRMFLLAAPIALLTAAGCSVEVDRDSGEGDRSAKVTEAEAKARVVRRPDRGEAEPRLAGRWSRDADCGRTLELRGDGTMTSFDGAPGTWSMQGDSSDGTMLRMEGKGQLANMEVTLIADDELHLRDTDPGTGGNTLHMQRCG